ncbi:MAG: hypothetical protein ACK57Q_10215 [Planctomycetota bacterium]
MEYAAGVKVRRVDQDGWFSYRGRGWKAGRAFAGQPVGLRPTATDGVLEVLFLTQVLRGLDLRENPTHPVPQT